MDEITKPIGAGIPTPVTKEAEKEAIQLAKKEAEALKYFTDNFPPKSEEDVKIIKDLARRRAEAQVSELRNLEPEHLIEKPAKIVGQEAVEKSASMTAKEAAEEVLRNKQVTEDLLKGFRLKAAAGKIGRGAMKMVGPLGTLVDVLNPTETVSEEEEMKQLEQLKKDDGSLAKIRALEKLRSPTNNK